MTVFAFQIDNTVYLTAVYDLKEFPWNCCNFDVKVCAIVPVSGVTSLLLLVVQKFILINILF